MGDAASVGRRGDGGEIGVFHFAPVVGYGWGASFKSEYSVSGLSFSFQHETPASSLPATPVAQPAPLTVPMPAGEIFVVAHEYLEAGRLDAAERMIGHVLAVLPNQPEALHTKGLIAFRRNRIAEAAVLMERSIAVAGGGGGSGGKSVHFRNISEVYRLLTRLDEAVVAARRAVSLDPADPLGPFNLAMVLFDRMEIDACIAAARHAIDLRGNLPQAHMKLGQALLLKGDMGPGWDEYEWRYQIPGAQPLMPKTERPQWDGRALGVGERVLLVGDQGFGDVVMFARYIPWVLQRCAEVAIACSGEMEPTLARMFPGVQLVTRWDVVPPFVFYCPFSGLPRLKGTRIDSIPAATSYLRADPGRVKLWRDRLDTLVPAGLKRIAIAWAGRPTHNNDHHRTITLETLAPLFEVAGIALISVQKGPAVAQIAGYKGRAPLIDLDAEIKDFEDTIAVLECVDLLISVDTSVVHFAGALGRPAWMMVPFAPDWRWLMGREDSPWYPSVRMFRHPQPKRWDLVVPRVAEALRGFVSG